MQAKREPHSKGHAWHWLAQLAQNWAWKCPHTKKNVGNAGVHIIGQNIANDKESLNRVYGRVR